MQQLHALWSEDTEESADTSKVILRATETIDEAHLHRIGARCEDNGNSFWSLPSQQMPMGRQWRKSQPDYGPPDGNISRARKAQSTTA